MKNYNLRAVTSDDVDFIYGLMETCFSKYVTEMFGGWDPIVQKEIVRTKFLGFDSKIIQKHNIDIGLLIVFHGDHEIVIKQFALLPQYRYIGLSARIVDDLKAEAMKKKVPISLRVLLRNLYAMKFWKAAGFTITSETETHMYMRWPGRI